MGVYINKAELLKELSVIQDRPVRSAMQIIKILTTIDLVRCEECEWSNGECSVGERYQGGCTFGERRDDEGVFSRG